MDEDSNLLYQTKSECVSNNHQDLWLTTYYVTFIELWIQFNVMLTKGQSNHD